jgi:hypothetical protein
MSQSGLHAEMCEIDHQLHAIVAGRKRSVLQSIQEETATNIYIPSPLQGLIGPDLNSLVGGPQTSRNSNVIWITGEFFGVQRARDMLYSVSLNKVCTVSQLTDYGFQFGIDRAKQLSHATPQFSLASWTGWSPTAQTT